MTDHKFTVDEVIKALECCRTIDGNDCKNCAYHGKIYEIGHGGCTNDLVGDALALINRQKAEIERLRKYNTDVAFKHYNDGIKEFAERLKANMSNIARMEYGGNIYFCVGYDLIDNLVKEMTEENNESKST